MPEVLVQYVENGRNPDIYTREFVELVRRMNQLARGKSHAFASFRDILAAQTVAAMPELRDDVKRVLEATAAPDDHHRTDPPDADPLADDAAGGGPRPA